jgi:hypothetical protein
VKSKDNELLSKDSGLLSKDGGLLSKDNAVFWRKPRVLCRSKEKRWLKSGN